MLSQYHKDNCYPKSLCLNCSLEYTFASINNTASAECFKTLCQWYSNCRRPSRACLFCPVLLCQHKWIKDTVRTSEVHRYESKFNTEYAKAERKRIFNITKPYRLPHKTRAVFRLIQNYFTFFMWSYFSGCPIFFKVYF